jgi:hypothetical protein
MRGKLLSLSHTRFLCQMHAATYGLTYIPSNISLLYINSARLAYPYHFKYSLHIFVVSPINIDPI